MKLTRIPWRYTICANMNFLDQGNCLTDTNCIHTYIQTDRHDRNNIPRSFAGSQKSTRISQGYIQQIQYTATFPWPTVLCCMNNKQKRYILSKSRLLVLSDVFNAFQLHNIITNTKIVSQNAQLQQLRRRMLEAVMRIRNST